MLNSSGHSFLVVSLDSEEMHSGVVGGSMELISMQRSLRPDCVLTGTCLSRDSGKGKCSCSGMLGG